MIKQYKEELLKNLGIYELRELARNIGVASPTTKKRKQLEQEITKISKGELAPTANQSKKGRPPKSIRRMENVLDVFVPKELLELKLSKKVDSQLEDVIKFSSSEKTHEGPFEITGFLRKTASGYYYFRNNANIEEFVSVPQSDVEKFSLLEGDKITAVCQKSPTENYYIANNLLQVNNAQPNPNRVLGSLNNIVLPKTSLKGFDGVNQGENVFLVTQSLKSGFEDIKNVFKLISDDYHVIILASSISTYMKLLLEKEFKGELIYSVVEDHPASVYENIINTCNHIDVLLQEGKKIVVLGLDIFTLTNAIQTFFAFENQKKTAQEEIEAVRLARRFVSYGKVLENGASVTVISHCLASETEEQLFKSDFAKLADKVFYL